MSDSLDFTKDNEPGYIKKRGTYILSVSRYINSQDIEGYRKAPFVKFITCDVETGKIANLMFWMPKDGDTEQRKIVKRKLIKEFLTSLGCNLSELTDNELLNCSIHKQAKVVLKEKERTTIGRMDKKPIIITDVEYYFSRRIDEKIRNLDESKLFVPLTSSERLKHETNLRKWNKINSHGNNAQGNG